MHNKVKDDLWCACRCTSKVIFNFFEISYSRNANFSSWYAWGRINHIKNQKELDKTPWIWISWVFGFSQVQKSYQRSRGRPARIILLRCVELILLHFVFDITAACIFFDLYLSPTCVFLCICYFSYVFLCTLMSVRAATGLDILLPVMPFLHRFKCLLFVKHELAQLINKNMRTFGWVFVNDCVPLIEKLFDI